jgi:hypothetical protein
MKLRNLRTIKVEAGKGYAPKEVYSSLMIR